LEYEFINSLGQIIEKGFASQLDISAKPSGFYFIKFPQVSGKTYKIVKK
jgi:hypothetical protein